MSGKQPMVYIVANRGRGTLYIGVTGWLKQRVHGHREGLLSGFTEKYGRSRLVWFEEHADFPSAGRPREADQEMEPVWKLDLIENTNPAWRDLGATCSIDVVARDAGNDIAP